MFLRGVHFLNYFLILLSNIIIFNVCVDVYNKSLCDSLCADSLVIALQVTACRDFVSVKK